MNHSINWLIQILYQFLLLCLNTVHTPLIPKPKSLDVVVVIVIRNVLQTQLNWEKSVSMCRDGIWQIHHHHHPKCATNPIGLSVSTLQSMSWWDVTNSSSLSFEMYYKMNWVKRRASRRCIECVIMGCDKFESCSKDRHCL